MATFRLIRDFTGEELAQISAYAKRFKEQAKLMLEQRADQNEAGIEGAVEMERGAPLSLPDNEGHFAIGVVDGERDELPL